MSGSDGAPGPGRVRHATSLKTLAPYGFLLAAWLVLLPVLDIGWSPVDDGALSHAADRVNQGELPHLDFYEPYTGGLSFLNSVALRGLGYDLLSLRFPLWVLIGVWMVALFSLGRKVLSPWEAALAVGGLAAVSFLMHMTPMPSWYNLVLGTMALLFTVRFTETAQRAWLVLAGLSVGLSFLAKSSGLVFALVVGFVLSVRAIRGGNRSQVALGRVLLVMGAATAGVLISTLVNANRLIFFFLPICLFVASEWQPGRGHLDTDGVALGTELGLVSVGIAMPLGAFAFHYSQSEALGPLVTALVNTPAIISELASNPPGPGHLLVPALVAGVLWRISQGSPRQKLGAGVLLGVLIVVGYWNDAEIPLLFGLWVTEWASFAAGVMYFSYSLLRRTPSPMSSVAIVGGAVTFALIGFPSFNEYYAFYMLPLGGLGLLAMTKLTSPKALRPLLFSMAAFLAVFAFAKIEGRWMTLGPPDAEVGYILLEPERGGIRIPKHFGFYNEMIARIELIATPGEAFVVGPDSPEVYFLTGLTNESPTLFDRLAEGLGSPVGTLSMLEGGDPGLFLQNHAPIMSSRIDLASAHVVTTLVARYTLFDLYRLGDE